MLLLGRNAKQGIKIGHGGLFVTDIYDDWCKVAVWWLGSVDAGDWELSECGLFESSVVGRKLPLIEPGVRVVLKAVERQHVTIGIDTDKRNEILRIELLDSDQLSLIPSQFRPD